MDDSAVYGTLESVMPGLVNISFPEEVSRLLEEQELEHPTPCCKRLKSTRGTSGRCFAVVSTRPRVPEMARKVAFAFGKSERLLR